MNETRTPAARPAPRCLLDRSRPCGGCVAASPAECPYGYLLADDATLERRAAAGHAG